MMKCIVYVGNPFKRFFNRVCLLHSFMHTSSSFSCAVQSSKEDEAHELDDYVQLKSRMEQYASSGCVANAVESLCAMRIFEGKPTVKEYNRLFYCYFGSGNVASEAVFELYKAMKSFGPCPNASTFNTLLYGMISCGDFRNGIVIAEDMCSSGFRPFSHFMSRLLKKSLESGGLYYSLCVLEFMLRFGYIPSPSAANMLIKSLCNVGMIRKTHVLFCALLEKSNNYFHGGYGYTHNKILWALCKSGQMYNVLAFFCYLRKKGIVYNVYSYTALVYGFCREKRWNDTFYCLSVMEIDGCRPNVITYTVILKYLCDAGKIQEALGLLEKMEKEGCIPDLVTLNIVLRELCLRNMTVEMGKLIGLMRGRGFSPDAFTYAALAGGFLKRGKVEAAKKFLLDRDCVVDAAVCNIYFHALCCERKSEEALSLVNSMMEMGIEPNNISYNTILKGICKEKNLDEALKFFDHIRWGTNTPDLVSFNTVLSAACKEGNWLVIRRILYQMGSEGFHLNVVSATCLIHYFCKIGEIPKCVKLLKSMMAVDMYRENLKPDAVTWKSFVYELCKECKISVALQLLRQMRENGINPDIGIYITIFKALLKRGSFWDIVMLFKEMAQDQCEADEASFELFDRAMSESWLKDFPREGKQLKALLVGTSRVKIAS